MRYGRWWTAALVVLPGCGAGPAGPVEATCVAVVQAAGRTYRLADAMAPDPAAISTAVFAEVHRRVGCNDTPEPGEVVDDVDEDGESNFLAVGTTLHVIDGVPASSRLAVYRAGEWQVLTTDFGG